VVYDGKKHILAATEPQQIMSISASMLINQTALPNYILAIVL